MLPVDSAVLGVVISLTLNADQIQSLLVYHSGAADILWGWRYLIEIKLDMVFTLAFCEHVEEKAIRLCSAVHWINVM